jgi:predicted RND superfamily exporter protein
VLAVFALPKVRFEATIENWVPPNSMAAIRYHDFLSAFQSDAFLIITFPDSAQNDAVDTELTIATFLDGVSALPEATGVSRWPVPGVRLKHTADPGLQSYVITFTTPSHLNPDSPEFIQAVRRVAEDLGLVYHLAGTGVLTEAIVHEAQVTLVSYMLISLSILVVILGLSLRSGILVLKVLGVPVGGVLSMFIVMGLFGIPFYVEQTILPVLVLVYGTSSSLHLIFHGNRRQVRVPCGLAILTTALGFSIFAFSPVPLLEHFAVMALSGLGGGFLTLLLIFPSEFQIPRHLQMVNDTLSRVRLPPRNLVFGFALALLVLSIPGLLRIETHIDGLGVIDPQSPAVRDHFFVEERIGNYSPLEFTINLEKVSGLTVRSWMRDVFERPDVSAMIGYQAFRPLFDPVAAGYVSEDGRIGRVTYFVPLMNTSEGAEFLREISTLTEEHFPSDPPEPNGYLTLYLSVVQELSRSFSSSIVFAVLIISMALALFIRDVKLLLAAIVVNILPVAFILGLMGWLSLPLDLVTVPIGCLLLSVVVDDSIHFLYWFKQKGQVRQAFAAAGPGAILTSLVMVAGFSVFIFSPIPPMKNFGILMLAAMISALLSDLILLPLFVRMFSNDHQIGTTSP